MSFRFVRWGPEKTYALFEYEGRLVNIPFSRLIPHALCESSLRSIGVKDPNRIARLCAESSSIFGPVAFRHYLHLSLAYGNTLVREREKEYLFPETIDFSCVRDLIIRGEDTDEAIRRCS